MSFSKFMHISVFKTALCLLQYRQLVRCNAFSKITTYTTSFDYSQCTFSLAMINYNLFTHAKKTKELTFIISFIMFPTSASTATFISIPKCFCPCMDGNSLAVCDTSPKPAPITVAPSLAKSWHTDFPIPLAAPIKQIAVCYCI